ncbi:MAG: IS5 family transposase [Bacteroidales bacterium]|jgi:IS5 family transposase|nr:IS5 family transposase [Bacteroidales bacterium]
MITKIDKTPQLEMFKTPLEHFIKDDHQLVLLSRRINWDSLEDNLSKYYCIDNGRPSIPIRTIAGILILKRMFNESDESVLERWVENPYWQHLCGEVYFQYNLPFDRTELIKFRNRIGEEGAEQILKMSIHLFTKKEIYEKEVLIDTTVQEKNITYPTDAKLQKKIIEKCRKIAKDEKIQLHQIYKRELKQLMIDQRFRNHPKRRKKALAAGRRIKVIAGRIFRDLHRKLDNEQHERYKELFDIFRDVLIQKKKGKNKIYSIHQPYVNCIAKGKEAKKYEFGNKSSIVKTKKSGIIVGAMAFTENIYDGDTLEPQLEQTERLIKRKPKFGVVDRGYRGRKIINGIKIIIPKKLPTSATRYQIQKIRKLFRARAGIEPIIGHLKQDHRMNKNYLLDEEGDKMNTILAAAGFNLRKMLQRLKAEAQYIYILIWNFIFINRKLELKTVY